MASKRKRVVPAEEAARSKSNVSQDVGLDRFEGYRVLQNGHTHPLKAIKLSSDDLLVIGFSTWKDQASLDIRVHFLTPAPDRYWQPTKQGIRIVVEDAAKVLDFIAQQKDVVKLILGEIKS